MTADHIGAAPEVHFPRTAFFPTHAFRVPFVTGKGGAWALRSMASAKLRGEDKMNHPVKLQQQVKAASDAFTMMLETHFAAWKLTGEECAVARLGLKGYDVYECADILKIRADIAELHQGNVFFKVGVSRWSDLLRFFIDQLHSGAESDAANPFVWS